MKAPTQSYNPVATGRVKRDQLVANLAEQEARKASMSTVPPVDTMAPNPFEGFDFANAYADEWFAPQPDQATTVEFAFCKASVVTAERRALSC